MPSLLSLRHSLTRSFHNTVRTTTLSVLHSDTILAKVFIRGLGDDLACFSTGCGDVQGDVLAPVKFMQAFAPAVENAIKASQSWADQLMLYAWDPLSGT
eukprot:16435151-Heterocapsa_arctica.AAC.1